MHVLTCANTAGMAQAGREFAPATGKCDTHFSHKIAFLTCCDMLQRTHLRAGAPRLAHETPNTPTKPRKHSSKQEKQRLKRAPTSCLPRPHTQ
jgi:hypothetical protein